MKFKSLFQLKQISYQTFYFLKIFSFNKVSINVAELNNDEIID